MLSDLDSALVTSAELKDYRGTGSSTSEDTLITATIPRASARISEACGRKFASTAYTEYHSGGGRTKLWLRAWPIVSITSVHVDSDRQFAAATAFTQDTGTGTGDYVAWTREEEWGLLETVRGRTWSAGTRNIKVVYTGGYATIPAAIKHACLRICSLMMEVAQKNLHAVRSASAGAGSGSQGFAEPVGLPEDVEAVCRAWRRPLL